MEWEIREAFMVIGPEGGKMSKNEIIDMVLTCGDTTRLMAGPLSEKEMKEVLVGKDRIWGEITESRNETETTYFAVVPYGASLPEYTDREINRGSILDKRGWLEVEKLYADAGLPGKRVIKRNGTYYWFDQEYQGITEEDLHPIPYYEAEGYKGEETILPMEYVWYHLKKVTADERLEEGKG